MTMSDPIADMLTRIRNAILVRHGEVLVPHSKAKLAIAQILRDEGFIEDFRVTGDRPQPVIRIRLKYDEEREPVLTGLERISKPGRRIYVGKDKLPWVLEGLGVAVVSTSRGVMTAKSARGLKVGGEVWCHIW